MGCYALKPRLLEDTAWPAQYIWSQIFERKFAMDTFDAAKLILTQVAFLMTGKNPVCRLAPSKLPYVLLQYSQLVQHIVSFLERAVEAAESKGWSCVQHELLRNIGQELGSDTNGVPHCQMFARAMASEFALDIWHVFPSSASYRFFDLLGQLLNYPNPYVVLGAAYALEATAVPELKLVLDLVEKLARSRGQMQLQAETADFFDRHLKHWEPSHEKGLRSALEIHLLDPKNVPHFNAGFIHVLRAMDEWWQGLAREATSS